ncbi:Uncharacterised protein [Mycobacteroides abscessus subsp. abscessus]|nr:Uncharacterised protein [Mycobacteroides abscessus subsp. abscessus]
MQGARVLTMALVIETVVHGTVDHGVELCVPSVELGGIGHLEVDRYPRGRCALFRLFDGGRREIQPGDRQALLCEVDGVLAEAAADVQDRTPQGAVGRELFDARLCVPDIPWDARGGCALEHGLAVVDRFESFLARYVWRRGRCRHGHQGTPRSWRVNPVDKGPRLAVERFTPQRQSPRPRRPGRLSRWLCQRCASARIASLALTSCVCIANTMSLR